MPAYILHLALGAYMPAYIKVRLPHTCLCVGKQLALGVAPNIAVRAYMPAYILHLALDASLHIGTYKEGAPYTQTVCIRIHRHYV